MALSDFWKKTEKIVPGLISKNNPAAVSSGKTFVFFETSKPTWIEEKLDTALKTITESGQGRVSTSIGFQKSLSEKRGEDKPYDYGIYEAIYTAVPMANAATDMTIDFTVCKGLYVTSENEQVVEECEALMKKINFDIFLRQVVKHMLVYGDCFVEIVTDGEKDTDGNETTAATEISDLKILHPKTMKVRRDEHGEILGYIQELGTGVSPVNFEPHEIAHFVYNQIGDRAYGTSMYEPLLNCLRIKLQMERDMGFLLERKANAPYHIKIGSDQYPATQTDIDSFASELAALKARNEWVTSHLIDIAVVGFQGKILDLKPFSEHFDNQIVYGLRVPYVLLGLGNIPEGLARVQQETFERHTQSIQLSVQKVLEKDIFGLLVKVKKFEELPKLEWGKQSDEEKQKEVEYFLKLLSAPLTDDTKVWTENKIRDLLGIEGQVTPEQRKQSLEKNLAPQGPGFPQGEGKTEKSQPEKPEKKDAKGAKDGDSKAKPKASAA